MEIPEKGTINLHASLLPQLRGAAPIHWAIINGLSETGVTTFFINEKIDFGNIIEQSKLKINSKENTGELEAFAKFGSDLDAATLKVIEKNNFKTTKQNNSEKLLIAPKLNKNNTRIDWKNSGQSIFNLIRGLSPIISGTKDAKSNKILKIFDVIFHKEKNSNENLSGTILIKNNTIRNNHL